MDDSALRRGDALLAALHVAQAAVILALSTVLPSGDGTFMEGQPGSGGPKQDLLFDLRIGPLVRRSCCSQRRPRARRAATMPRTLRAMPLKRASIRSAGWSIHCRPR